MLQFQNTYLLDIENSRKRMGLRLLKSAAILLLAACMITACKKPDNKIGTDLLPDGQELGTVVVDTISLYAYTRTDDSVRTSQLTRNMLGSYLDRDFGTVKASIATQILLSTNNVGDGLDPLALELDSIVLSMEYDDFSFGYGHLDPQIFRVYELNELLESDSAFYSNERPDLKSEDLVKFKNELIRPRPLNTALVGDDTLSPQLRIPLSDDLGNRFLSLFGQQELVNNTAFLDYFNGLFIEVDNDNLTPYQRGVLYFDLLDGDSKVSLYYRDTSVGAEDTLVFDFIINSSAARFTNLEFDHSQAITTGLNQSLNDSDWNQYSFVQAGGGLRSVIETPYIENFKDEDLSALNKVELVIPVDPSYSPFATPSEQLFLFRKDNDDQDAITPDQLGNFGSTSGLFDETEQEYRFNLTLYFQNILSGQLPNNGLHVVSNNSGVSVNRTILQGPQHPLDSMRMELTFTEF